MKYILLASAAFLISCGFVSCQRYQPPGGALYHALCIQENQCGAKP